MKNQDLVFRFVNVLALLDSVYLVFRALINLTNIYSVLVTEEILPKARSITMNKSRRLLASINLYTSKRNKQINRQL